MESKIDLRVIKSQKAINDEFVRMLKTIGFDNLTVKEITTNALISRKTFYLHYLDKFDLLDKFVDEQIHILNQLCRSKDQLGFIEGTIVWFDFIKSNSAIYTALFSIQSTNAFRDRLLNFMENEIQHHAEDHANMLRSKIATKFLSMAVFGIMESFILNQLNVSVEEIGTEIGALLEYNMEYFSSN